jgi:hypothetical protein
MVCLIDNGRAVRMARRLDGTLRFRHGEAEAIIEPLWPRPWTWLEEVLLQSGGALKSRTGQPRRIRNALRPHQVTTEGAVRPVRARIPAIWSAIRINGSSATCGSRSCPEGAGS